MRINIFKNYYSNHNNVLTDIVVVDILHLLIIRISQRNIFEKNIFKIEFTPSKNWHNNLSLTNCHNLPDMAIICKGNCFNSVTTYTDSVIQFKRN